MEQLPNRIRELRKARGLYLEQLADRVGCSVGFLSDLERGGRNLSFEWMKRIAKVLKVKPGDLLNVADNAHSLSAEEQELIDLFGRADDPQKAQIVQMARILVGGAAPAARRRAANS